MRNKIPPGNSWRPLTAPMSGRESLEPYVLQKTITRSASNEDFSDHLSVSSKTLGFRFPS